MKQMMRAFSIGVLVSTLLLAAGYFFLMEERTAAEPVASVPTEKEMISQLEKNGYTVTLVTEDDVEPEEETSEINEEQQEKQEKEELNIQIKKGMTLSDIVNKLEKSHIVEDGEAFSIYMNEQGYSTRIQLGTFTLHEEMSYKEIASQLTGK